jgi:signal transduction histidine kinase
LPDPPVVIMVRFHYSLFKSVPVILAVGAVILLGVVLGALYFSQRAADESDSAVSVGRLNTRVLRLLSTAQDAETGQRGYLLTGDTRYLEPFTRSSSSIPAEITALTPPLLDIGVSMATIDDLRSMLTQKLAEMQKTIELKSAGDSAGALALVQSNVGINLMDEIRDRISDIQQRGVANSALHLSALKASTTSLSTIIAVSAGLLVLIAGGAMRLIGDHTRQIEAAHDQLSRANETLEEAVTARTQSLQRANNELQTYTYIVSHDLRAPLVNIMGFTEELDRASGVFRAYLERTHADPNDRDGKAAIEAVETDIPEALGFIRSSMKRMDNLINQILVMARAGNRELHRDRVRLKDLLDETLETLRHRLDEAEISVEVAGALPEVQSDKLALQQIVGNLLDNAIKYMDPSRAGHIGVRGWRNGVLATLEISDNGRGIADGDQERIFELFRRSGRQDRPGDGVGLAHVRALARRLGGDVKVRSALGEGTTFEVSMVTDIGRLKKVEME